MWIQTTQGTFAVARSPEDAGSGMLRLLSNSYGDLLVLSERHFNGIDPISCSSGYFTHYLRAPESLVTLVIAKLASEVWYTELPVAIETLSGSKHSAEYWNMHNNLHKLQPQQECNVAELSCKEQVILEVGCEGGSLSIGMKEENGQRSFVAHIFDSTPSFLSAEDGDGVVINSGNEFTHWDEAMECLSQHQWWKLHPLAVAQQFQGLIIAELRQRGVDPMCDEWSHLLQTAIDFKESKY